MAEELSPRFKHECPDCTYLGRYDITTGTMFLTYDLYMCRKNTPVFVARYDNVDSYGDYGFQSSLNLLAQLHPAVVEAKKRAEERGLLAVTTSKA